MMNFFKKKEEKDEFDKNSAKIAMTKAVNMGLEYKSQNKAADADEVVSHIMSNLDEEGQTKICCIAAVSKAIDYKIRTKATDKEINQKMLNEYESLINETIHD
jgi:hypothetical protein